MIVPAKKRRKLDISRGGSKVGQTELVFTKSAPDQSASSTQRQQSEKGDVQPPTGKRQLHPKKSEVQCSTRCIYFSLCILGLELNLGLDSSQLQSSQLTHTDLSKRSKKIRIDLWQTSKECTQM